MENKKNNNNNNSKLCHHSLPVTSPLLLSGASKLGIIDKTFGILQLINREIVLVFFSYCCSDLRLSLLY